MTTTTPDFDAYEAKCNAAHRLAMEILPGNKSVLFDALNTAGVQSVTIEFDGYGDEGQIESITASAGDTEIPIPAVTIEYRVVNFDGPDIKMLQMTLRDVLETMTYDFLEAAHAGWEDGEGSRATFTFDVAERSITLDYNERYIDYHNHVHKF